MGTNAVGIVMGVRRVACALALVLAAAASARAQANPNFDTVTWTPLGCGASPLTAIDLRGEINLVGDATFPAAYVARDATYLYLRYRVDDDPRASQRGFLPSSDWTMLLQVPSGNAFQYQYQLSLSGDGTGGADTVEVWANNPADDVSFEPLSIDDSETKLVSLVFDQGAGVNTTPLARALPTGDGSSFRDDPDYFVEVAFPIQTLLDHGVIASASDLADALFWPATATSANRHNKDFLNCPFLPLATVPVNATFSPPTVPANTTTRVTETIVLTPSGRGARGLRLTQDPLPAPLVFVSVTVDSGNPGVTWTLASENPLDVRVPDLPVGATLTVRIVADVHPGCSDVALSATASLRGTNVEPTTGTATLTVAAPGTPEVCDGVDNDCDNVIDEGGPALCDDHIACNGTETCGGQAGCQPGTPLDCDDGLACSIDSCEEPGGCVHVRPEGCPPCQSNADCNDDKACTDDVCDVGTGTCRNVTIPNCVPCATAGECNDGDPCTDEACPAGACENVPRAGCTRCTTAAQCDDANGCTTDSCDGGVCTNAAIPGCVPCNPSPEVCAGGADEDCDTLVDCADPDCTGAPACVPPPEDCDNCLDDDRDGVADTEDPDCCPAPMDLGVTRIMLRPTGKPRGSRLRLVARYAASTPPLFDPLRQDTTIQLTEVGLPLLCTTVHAQHWRRTRRLLFRFKDRGGRFAGGLDGGAFRINRQGNVVFSAHSRALALDMPESSTVRLTIRVGAECSQSTVVLRPGRKGLVFP